MRATLCSVSLFAAAAAAQESRGPFVGLPAALGVDATAAALDADGIYHKAEGFAPGAPANSTSHDLHAILALHGGAGIDVDDFSTGLDWLQVDDNTGRILVPQNQWAGITFSVTASTVGAPGSRIASEALNPGGAGAAVFSYVFPGSALPGALVDTVERVHSRDELGFANNVDVDGLDQLLPMWSLDPAMAALLPQREIYFTVDAASIALVPLAWWGTATPSGAVIFRVTQPGSGPTWTAPQVWMRPRDLGLLDTDDIDALSVDLLDQRILLSTRTPSLDPLLFVYYGTDFAQAVPLQKPDGTPVGSSVGVVQNDDVDAVCAMDPSIRSHAGVQNPFYYYLGTPRPPLPQPWPALHGSACRGFDGVDAELHAFMSGWTPSGPGPGLAALLLTFGDNLAPIYSLSPIYLRNPTPVFAGDPLHFSTKLPALPLGSLPVTLRWVAVDSAATDVVQAWPIKINL